MFVAKVVCPHCSKRLKTSKPLTVGHRVLCSGCGRSFAVPADAIANRANPIPATDAAPAPQHAAAIASGSEVAPAPRRSILGIALVLGCLLLLAGATAGLTLYFATRPEPPEPSEQASTSSPSGTAGTDIEPSDAESELLPVDRPHPSQPAPHRAPSPPPPSAPRTEPDHDSVSWLPAKEQGEVNKAIDIGVQWLKNMQSESGHWGLGPYPVGLAALPALTLLECGVPADNSHIQKALRYVRAGLPGLTKTYELALVILFLDRLGDPRDVPFIRTCALRLVAGQKPSGGWVYDCPLLKPQQENDLLTVMRYQRPQHPLDLYAPGPNLLLPPDLIRQAPGAVLNKPVDPDLADKEAYEHNKALTNLPPELRQLPALQLPKESHRLAEPDNTDNSNTQFATLGLSAAARHDVPLERALALIAVRFHRSQVPSGGWNYHFSAPARAEDVRPAMVGAGLLGLAVALGLAADHVQPQATPRPIQDPAIERGFNYLAPYIGKPLSNNDAQINLYTLWTIERCGVLYNRRQIGGKDWYPWGVKLLLQSQRGDGSWNHGHYFAPGNITPITDTCFALLFLKRANLAKHLTKKLEFITQGKLLQDR
jgi:hypothetical protein